MEDTNREKITPSENKFMENCIPASEQMASATNIEEDTLQSTTDCTPQSEKQLPPQTEQQTDLENKPTPPLAKRIAWYDIVVFILMFFILAVAAVGAKMMSQTEVEMEVADWISNMVMGNWLLIGGVAFIVAVAISILVSVRIMEKKQF